MSFTHFKCLWHYFNNKELWPIWIGYTWFCVLITLRVFGEIGPIDLKSWSTFDDLRLQLVSYSLTLCYLIVSTLITVSVSHFCLKQKINYSFYVFIFLSEYYLHLDLLELQIFFILNSLKVKEFNLEDS